MSYALAAGTSEAVPPCLSSTLKVAAKQEGRCTLQLQAHRVYRIGVDQTNLDVSLELESPQGNALGRTDSPARRASAEVLTLMAPVSGNYVLTLRSVDHESAQAALRPSLEALGDSDVDRKRAAVGMLMTEGAAVRERSGRDSAALQVDKLLAASALSAGAGLEQDHADVLLRLAATYYWSLGDWQAAAKSALDASHAAKSSNESLTSAQAAVIRGASLIEMAHAEQQSGKSRNNSPGLAQFGEAEELFLRSAEIFRSAGRRYDQAHALNNAGITYHYQGRYDEARDRYRQAAAIFAELAESPGEKLPLQNLAQLDFERGEYVRARDGFQSLLQKMTPADDPKSYVAVLGNAGNVLSVTGDFDGALAKHVAALNLSRAEQYPAGEARSLQGLGTIYRRVGETSRAIELYERSLALRRTLDDRRGSLGNLSVLAEVQRATHPAAALKYDLEAAGLARSATEQARTLLAVAEDHLALKDLDAAFQALRAAMQVSLPEQWPLTDNINATLGYATLLSGDERGRAMLEQSVTAHLRRGRIDEAALGRYRLALADYHAGRLEMAAAAAEGAASLYARERVQATNPDLRAAYFATRSAAFDLRAEIELARAEQSSDKQAARRRQLDALALVEAGRQRILNEWQQLAHVGSVLATLTVLDQELAAKRHRLMTVAEQENPSARLLDTLARDVEALRARIDLAEVGQGRRETATPSADPVAMERAQRALPADTVVLRYLLGDERSHVWAATRTGLQVFTLPARRDIELAADELSEAWGQPPATDADLAREQQLSRVILGAAEPVLRSKRALVVVAEGSLSRVPFGALWLTSAKADRPRRAVETLVISRRSLFDHQLKSERSVDSQRLLLIGDPVPWKPASPGDAPWLAPATYSALPGARDELAQIAALAGDRQVQTLSGSAATKHALLSAPLESFGVLHFATHARADVQDVQLSSLVLSAPNANSGSADSSLTLREIASLPLRADLVVLSACETSKGKELGGRTSLGLPQAFLAAGSRQVLASLWRVSDVASREYMRAFYRDYLGAGHDAAPAAQHAALELMRTPRFSHPYFWGAFELSEG